MSKNRQKKSVYDVNFESIMKAQILASAISKDIANFRIRHILRVTDTALKLASYYPEGVIDVRKVRIMTLLHDMFKYLEEVDDDHGNSAAEYLSMILKAFDMAECERNEWDNVLEALCLHSVKDAKSVREKNPYLAILQDADSLDKISVGWIVDTNKIFCPKEKINITADFYIKKSAGYEGTSPGYHELYSFKIGYLKHQAPWCHKKITKKRK